MYSLLVAAALTTAGVISLNATNSKEIAAANSTSGDCFSWKWGWNETAHLYTVCFTNNCGQRLKVTYSYLHDGSWKSKTVYVGANEKTCNHSAGNGGMSDKSVELETY